MSTQQQLRDAQKRLREATKKRRQGAKQSGPDFLQLGLEQGETSARSEVKGLQAKAAEENRQARDQRSANARRLRQQNQQMRQMANPASATFSGSAEDRRLQQQATAQPTGMPIDAAYRDDGRIDLSGVSDNQVLRHRDGTFVKFSQETGRVYPVVFDVDRDTFVSENYKTPEGLGNIKRRLATSMSDIGRFARDTGNAEVQSELQKLQRDVDAIDNDPSLRPQERDQALVDLYNKNRFLFDAVDSARVQTAGQAQMQAAQEAAAQLQLKSDQHQIDLANARKTLFAGFEPGKTAAFDSSAYEIPDEDIERAYQTRTQYRSGYDEAFREKLAELSQSQPDNPANVQRAHTHAFVTAGMGTPEEAARSGMGMQLFPDRRSFEIDYRKQRGVDRRTATAMADISRATGLVQAEIDGLTAGPLSAEAYDDYIGALVRAGVPRVQADAEYHKATVVLQGALFTANNNLRTLQARRGAILQLNESAGFSDVTNAEVMKFAFSRGIPVPQALAMLRTSHLQASAGMAPYQVENKRQAALDAVNKADNKVKAPSRRDRAGGPKG